MVQPEKVRNSNHLAIRGGHGAHPAPRAPWLLVPMKQMISLKAEKLMDISLKPFFCRKGLL